MHRKVADLNDLTPSTLRLRSHSLPSIPWFQAGKGADWIATATRPWDPPLAANGRLQAAAAAARLRQAGHLRECLSPLYGTMTHYDA